MSLCGCKSDHQETKAAASEPEPGVMLVDYYDAVVGTEGGDLHREYVLYTYDSEFFKMSVYVQDSPEEAEIEKVYLVPLDARDRCFEAIGTAGLRDWPGMEKPYAIDGRRTVVKFRDGDQYIRCSTDEMPDGGEQALDSVGAVLMSYEKDEFLTEEQETK